MEVWLPTASARSAGVHVSNLSDVWRDDLEVLNTDYGKTYSNNMILLFINIREFLLFQVIYKY